MDIPTGVEIPHYGHFAGGANLDQILQNPVDGVFVEDAYIPKALDVKFQRLQFEALFIRHVVDFDDRKIRQAGTGADAGELRTGNGNDVFPPGVLIVKRLQNLRLNRHVFYIRNVILDGKRGEIETFR